MKNPITVVVAEDVEIYMDGLLLALDQITGIKVIGQAVNGQQLVKMVADLNPGLVLTDILMPVMTGIEACRIITAANPQPAIIATTMFEEESLIIDMLEAGATSFVMKNAGKDELLTAIETTARGQSYYCPRTNKAILQYNNRIRAKLRQPQFTPREIEIIQLICQDYSHAQIAKKLFLSKTTIDICSHRILQKMNQRSAVGIFRYAVEHGLLDTRSGTT